MMNEITMQKVLYTKLHEALMKAEKDEISINELKKHTRLNQEDKAILERIDFLSTTKLPGDMGQLISSLDLQNPFLFIGRYIRCFSDANFVVHHLQLSLIAQLRKHEIFDNYPLIDNLVDCCNELTQLRTALMTSRINVNQTG
jgi:hypothetical protein